MRVSFRRICGLFTAIIYFGLSSQTPYLRHTIEDSFVHGTLEFKVIKSDFPMKFGNPGTNLIKFILEP